MKAKFLFFITLAHVVASLAMAQTVGNLDAQRADVILIRASASDGTIETAAGIYVGQDQQNAFFITAFHALQKNGTGDPVDQVEIQFFATPSSFTGKVFNRFSVSKDLAVVLLPRVNLPMTLPKMNQKDASAETPIHIIGHPPSASWTSWTGFVENEKEVGGEPEYFSTGSDPSLTRGYSGGPVLDRNGAFIGMHQLSSSSAAKNLKSSAIVSSLVAWHVPVTNLTSDDVDSRRFKIAREIVSDFDHDDVSAIRSHLASSLNDQTSNQQVRFTWTRSVGFLGGYISVISQTKRVVGAYTVYVTKAKFAKGNAELRLTFDKADIVDSIWLIPVGDHPASELEGAAKNVVTELLQGKFQAVFDAFADSIKAGNNVNAIAAPWNNVLATKGNFLQELTAQKFTEADFVDVRCKFSGGDVIVRVEFAPSMELTGINYFPAP